MAILEDDLTWSNQESPDGVFRCLRV